MLIFVRRRQKCLPDSCCSRRAWVNTKPWGGPRAMKALHANWLLWSPPFSRPQDVAFNCSPHISSKCALSYNPHTCHVTYNFPVLCFKFPNIYDMTTKQWNDGFVPSVCFSLFFIRNLFCPAQQVWGDMTRGRDDGNDGFFPPSCAPAPRPPLQRPFVKSPLS